MRKKTPLFLAALTACALLFASLPAFASQVNTHEAGEGDTVSFDIHAIACPTKVQAVDISVYYDSSSLNYVDGSLTTPALPGAVTNTSLDGEIRLNAVTLSGFDLMDDGTLASMEFTVAQGAAADITLYYEVKNFLDEKKTELKDTYTYDVTRVNSDDNDIPSEASSAVSEPAETDTSNEVLFELTTSSEDAAETSSAAAVSERTSAETASLSDIPSDKAITFDTLDTPAPDRSADKKRYMLILLCGVGVVILIGAAFAIMLKDKGGKGSHFSK